MYSKRETVDLSTLKPSKSLVFLYRNRFGRLILKVLISKPISVIVGGFLSSPLSRPMIKGFINKNNIDLEQFEKKKFSSYNDVFIRKINSEHRPICADKNIFIAPCDSVVSVYKIDNNLKFNIKNGIYDVASLIGDDKLAKEYCGGYLLVLRLRVTDYHRYCFIDNGKIVYNKKIKGKLHTVQPIALEKYDFFKENSREVTVINTENFGDIVQIEIGAMMVGKIVNIVNNGPVKRGEEKGFFKFGGSTIAVLVKKDIVSIDDEILDNTKNAKETMVKYGEEIGIKDKIHSNFTNNL